MELDSLEVATEKKWNHCESIRYHYKLLLLQNILYIKIAGIISYFPISGDEARLKWKYLRDQARKECRKQESEWDFLPKLQFLTNQFNDYEGTDSLQDDHFSLGQDYDPDQSTSFYNIEPPVEHPEPVAVAINAKDEEFDEFDSKPVIMETDFYDDDDDAQKSVTNEESKDEDVGFFDSLLPHVKKLSPAKKMMLRMKIQELVYNTVYNET